MTAFVSPCISRVIFIRNYCTRLGEGFNVIVSERPGPGPEPLEDSMRLEYDIDSTTISRFSKRALYRRSAEFVSVFSNGVAELSVLTSNLRGEVMR